MPEDKIIEGTARKDRKTKNLTKRISPGDIAFIYHQDLDRVSAEGLLKAGVSAVVNAYSFSTETYPNQGPKILYDAGIHLVEEAGEGSLNEIKEGKQVRIKGGNIFIGERLVGAGYVLGEKEIRKRLEKSRNNLDIELSNFAENTLTYISKEKKLLFTDLKVPKIRTRIENKNVLVAVRGHDYLEDIRTLKPFIRDKKPVIMAVDGGANALLEQGIRPDIIVGDMDSVNDRALKCGAEIVVHAYPDGKAPGLNRIENIRHTGKISLFPFQGTSEDAALVLAYELGANLIVLVGSHTNLIDFMDKGRSGMASTFLSRLKVGDRLVDAKGVSQIYQSQAKISHLLLLVTVSVFLLSSVVLISPEIRGLINLLLVKLQLILGF